jgi:energy-converting hydrogenase A subunit M|tara:strand:+ start:308 stop:631 length:324 start_codon:yes stop_codon:yes gene_type:complete
MPRKKTVIPSTIDVGGIEFKVVLSKIKDFGDMDIDTKTIRVRADLKPEEAFDTLMHETVHAALAVSGLTNILDDDNLEEAIVRMTDYLIFPLYKKQYDEFRKTIEEV